MRLVLQLVGRLFIVVILCLGAATVWATIDAHRSVDRATTASAERVSVALEALYWRELLLRSNRMREQLLPTAQWRTIETMGLISPGICVQIEPAGAFEKPLCGQSKGIGQIPPRWFAASVQTLLGDHVAVVRPISARAANAGSVSATPDPNAAIAGSAMLGVTAPVSRTTAPRPRSFIAAIAAAARPSRPCPTSRRPTS